MFKLNWYKSLFRTNLECRRKCGRKVNFKDKNIAIVSHRNSQETVELKVVKSEENRAHSRHVLSSKSKKCVFHFL